MAEQKKWVIVFLVYAELRSSTFQLHEIINNLGKSNLFDPNSDAQELKYLYDDILIAQHSDSVEVIIIYNRVLIDRKPHDITYVLRKSLSSETNTYYLKRLDRISTKNLSKKPSKLKKILRNLKTLFEWEQTLFFTWDHGGIFGIFKSEAHIENIKVEKVNDKDVFLNRNQPYIRNWENNFREIKKRQPFIENPCDNLSRIPTGVKVRDMLTNEELSSVFSAFGKKVDILVMMNCCMQNSITAFALKDKVRYLIAPQSEINRPAYNYVEIINEILKDPNLDSRLLSIYAIEFLTKKRNLRDMEFLLNTDTWAILCLDLKYYYLAIQLINRLAEELLLLLKEEDNRIKIVDRRTKFYPFDDLRQGISNYMIDLRNCLYQYSDLSQNIKSLHFQYEVLQEKLIVAKYIGKKIYETPQSSKFYDDNLTPSGITLYFPMDSDSVLIDIFQTFIAQNATSRSRFFSKTKWLNFVCSYLDN